MTLIECSRQALDVMEIKSLFDLSGKVAVLIPEIQEKMLRHTPIHRLGEVSDIAQAVLFFASPASAWISGQVLFVNGGGDQTLD